MGSTKSRQDPQSHTGAEAAFFQADPPQTLLNYFKAGFGVMLGAMAAIALVDLIENAFDEDDDDDVQRTRQQRWHFRKKRCASP